MGERICKGCGNPIPPERHKLALFCSDKCKNRSYLKEAHELNPRPKVDTATSGALAEFRVVVDLLMKGYEVFRACSPSASCDLAVLIGDHLYRIEVRTGKYMPWGKIYYPPKNKADVMAVVLHNKITYVPELPGEV